MEIKLIALDMDGTTLLDDKTISPKNMQVLRDAQARGILVVPATGRPRKIIPDSIFEVGGIQYSITSNGACVYDHEQEQVLYSNLMTPEEALNLMDFLSQYDLFVEAYSDGQSYTERQKLRLLSEIEDFPQIYMDFILATQNFVDDLPAFLKQNDKKIEKVNLPYIEPKLCTEVLTKLREMKEYTLTSSFFNNIEINRAGASKGDALSHLCKRLGIRPQEVMAFGDGDNDVEMLKFAGCGVAMGNAIERLKNCADFITLSNHEDGVAYAIERLID